MPDAAYQDLSYESDLRFEDQPPQSSFALYKFDIFAGDFAAMALPSRVAEITIDGVPAALGVALNSFLTSQTIKVTTTFDAPWPGDGQPVVSSFAGLFEVPQGFKFPQPDSASILTTLTSAIKTFLTDFLLLVAQEHQIVEYVEGGTYELERIPRELAGYSRPTTGSRRPNNSLALLVAIVAFDPSEISQPDPVIATPLEIGKSYPLAPFIPFLPSALFQDEVDILRQEYLDFGAKPSSPPALGPLVPRRSDVVAGLGGGLNRGNYNVQLDGGLQARFDGTLNAYRGRQVVVDGAGTPLLVNNQPVTISQGAGLQTTSSYRNPRRNVDAGSQFPLASKHVWGSALDLVPDPTTGLLVDGTTIPLDLHAHLYPTLRAAARTQAPVAFTEAPDHVTQLPPEDPNVICVHMQW